MKGFRIITMQGIQIEQKNRYNYMRVGYADKWFMIGFTPLPLLIIIILAIEVYNRIPATHWRLVQFLSIYNLVVLTYLNVGVWLHEQLHCLAFRNNQYSGRVQIFFERKCILFLNGYYRVSGVIDYRTMRRALLGPVLLVIGLLVIGGLGSLVLTGWWFAIMASLAMAALLDMTHDIYMLNKISFIGDRGKYWDKGHYLEVVWKQK